MGYCWRVLQMSLIVVLMFVNVAARGGADQVKPGCQESCGNITIPYPFGTTPDCYIDPNFLISCNTADYDPPRAFLTTSSLRVLEISLEVLEISLEGQLRISGWVGYDCYNSTGSLTHYLESWINLGKFTISTTQNKFTAVGCDTYAVLHGSRGKNYKTGCLSFCNSTVDVINGSCSGIGCCQTPIPRGIRGYHIRLKSISEHRQILDFNPCSYGFVAEDGAFNFSFSDLYNMRGRRKFPVVLDWAVGNQTCDEAEKDAANYACKENAKCHDSTGGPGYGCSCSDGYLGNPYLGCEDINECDKDHPNLNQCEHPKTCVNIPGNHTCSCPMWYHGHGRRDGERCTLNHLQIIRAAIGIGVSLAVLLMSITYLCWALKKRRFIKLKKKYFQQNGGSELRQQLSSQGSNQRIKFYTVGELEKATKKFDESNIIGRGGFGIVYKGTLIDGRIVAIKKCKMDGESQGKNFINEVGILSQINHRHVVHLLGCCLETQVPSLVYEFINNGTLSDYIHDENKASSITWETRLRIATQTAEALYYLHSKASIPIIHRDVKSTNILLDEDYDVKVCDFGASRVISLDKTQLSTVVQGTPGYLDPESMQTNQVTEKSDVYSFGVVLVELLTGKKALFFDRPKEQRVLTMLFLLALKDDSLFEVLEDCIVKNGNHMQILRVAHLAKRCLSQKGEDRPTMKEVVVELEIIRMIGENVAEQSQEDSAYLHEESSTQCYFGNYGESSTATHSMVGSFLLPISDVR